MKDSEQNAADYLAQNDPVYRKVKKHLGYDYLYPAQIMIISMLLESAGYYGQEIASETPKQIIGVLPTGSGKSACFMIPILFAEGISIIVYPLKALINDQLLRFNKAGIPAVCYHGGLSASEKENSINMICERKVKAVLVNPEAFLNDTFFFTIQSEDITHVFIDEAHTVSEWGESFRPACMEMGKKISLLENITVTALTATAGEKILSGIRRILFHNNDLYSLIGNPNKPNIHYEICYSFSKGNTLIEILSTAPLPAIVFCASRVSAEMTASMLKTQFPDIDILFYHAGLSDNEKRSVELSFSSGKTSILTATCAFGLGIDISNIRTVIHRTLPPTPEAFLQESGRAGRDGKPAFSYAIISPEDLYAIAFGRSPRMKGLVLKFHSNKCRRDSILSFFGINDQVCSGCDVCDKKEEANYFLQLISWYKRISRILTNDVVIKMLQGSSSSHQSYPLIPSPPVEFSDISHAKEATVNIKLCIKHSKSFFPYLFQNSKRNVIYFKIAKNILEKHRRRSFISILTGNILS